MPKLPVIYVSHGSPMMALEHEKPAALSLMRIGEDLQTANIQAIAVVSAHWLSDTEVRISSAQAPEVMYDFYGFPDALYSLSYPVAGSFKVASAIKKQLQEKGIQVVLDENRGLDHGAWVPLRFMFPKADIPVVQLSIPMALNHEARAQIGNALQPLKEQGILLLFSGSLTHNLQDVRGPKEWPYVSEFSRWVNTMLQKHDVTSLMNYRELAPFARQSHPTEEHFIPLLMAMSASSPSDRWQHFNNGVDRFALAMDHCVWHAAS